ncbi:MAG TPA: globin domain-containing protein [Phycisphaerae bacterium]|nr:globin domain-containing protein [Phycisphaerae bacterium]HRW52134.1 globin domain-containing protein [Phycisphaerae bacterium]
MDATTVERLEKSFNLLAPRGPELVDRFYAHLFSKNPQVRPLFPSNMNEQKQKLLASIQLVMANVRKPDALLEPLTDMGRRHVYYGTQPAHYPVVRDTLISVMRDMAGDAWNDDFQRAWTDALNLIAGIMIEGHKAEQQSPKFKNLAATR